MTNPNVSITVTTEIPANRLTLEHETVLRLGCGACENFCQLRAPGDYTGAMSFVLGTDRSVPFTLSHKTTARTTSGLQTEDVATHTFKGPDPCVDGPCQYEERIPRVADMIEANVEL